MSAANLQESHLQQAERHVVEGEVRVCALALLIERSIVQGSDPKFAQELLLTLESLLLGMRADLARYQREPATGRGSA